MKIKTLLAWIKVEWKTTKHSRGRSANWKDCHALLRFQTVHSKPIVTWWDCGVDGGPSYTVDRSVCISWFQLLNQSFKTYSWLKTGHNYAMCEYSTRNCRKLARRCVVQWTCKPYKAQTSLVAQFTPDISKPKIFSSHIPESVRRKAFFSKL